MNNFLDILSEFQPITLSEMDGVSLLNRTDVKFVFNRSEIQSILSEAIDNYRVLVVENLCYSDYLTQYFDTDNFKFYYDHHNGRYNRYKVRMRTYVESDLSFFEIKFKNNKSRTIKSRIRIPQQEPEIKDNAANLLEKVVGISPERLEEKLLIKSKRITLVNKGLTERVTLDFDMNYLVNDEWHSYPEIMIAEVKQDKSDKSEFINIMRKRHIHQTSLSKYCFGMANFMEGIKYNNFKKQISYVNKISNRNAI